MRKYAFAIDLGTTTIDCCMFDIENGDCLARKNRKNKQSLYGRDVINRILNATRNNKVKAELKRIAVSLIEEMIKEAVDEKKLDYEALDSICISGNTTMISILLDLDVASLGVAPFNHELKKSVVISGENVFSFEKLKNIPVTLTGCFSAFIGGDILSGIIYLNRVYDGAFKKKKNALLIDLGTNGEMVLNANGSLYACSTACGPAFESCTRKNGVYGSSIIDALAMLFKTKNVTKDGMLKEPYFDNGIDIMNVHIDMDIIRAILLAKSAIYCGIISLARYAGVNLCDIEDIYIAGGFGFYLNVDNAILLGLIPKEFKGKIKIVGNTSLEGAIDILRYNMINEINDLSEDNIRLVQLAEDEFYKKILIDNMIFGVHRI